MPTVRCRQGHGLSQGTAAWLRQDGIDAVHLAGGFEAWRDAGQPLTRAETIPRRNSDGRTVWVTRERPTTCPSSRPSSLAFKAAVLVIVIEPLLRIATRALMLREQWVIAALF